MRIFFIIHISCFILPGLAKGQAGYEVLRLGADSITIDGQIIGSEWEAYPSWKLKPTTSEQYPFQATEVKMAWSDQYIYLLYIVSDNHLVANETQRDGEIYYDDCVEFFLSPTYMTDSMYFGFEMNSKGIWYDFVFFPNYQNGENFVLKSYNPLDVQVSTSLVYSGDKADTTGWIHEVGIPVAAFDSFIEEGQISEGMKCKFQLSRWDYQPNDGSSFTALSKTGVPSPHVFSKMPTLTFIAP